MTTADIGQPIDRHDERHENHVAFDKTVFGFWIYLMTDCILFATLFATYAVLHNNVYGGPSARDLFSLPFALVETLILLTSSFTCGLAMVAADQKAKYRVLFLYGITFLLGLAFLGMELREFSDFVREGNSWQRSAFLSSFFTLVGSHGLHITCGLLWMFVMMGHIVFRGLTPSTIRRLTCLSLFWHFLDVIWVLIFTFVYLMGVK
jgi:cytochrome o ubiquinol oxidase subunit 3